MNETDHEPIVTIAFLAAMADGQASPDERSRLRAALTRLGIANLDAIAQRVAQRQLPLAELTRQLSDDEARRLAYETALAVCHADGPVNEKETSFLNELRRALGLGPAAVGALEQGAAALAGVPLAAPATSVGAGNPTSDAEVDDLILDQAILTAAVDLLPEGLANVVILPLQLRLVYQIGHHHGHELDADQIKDLAATLGLGAVTQVLEGVVRKLVGGAARTLLGSVLGRASGLAAGAAVTFASTYALGHVAQRYYAQGRRLSADDLRALFNRFQEEARALFPKVRDRIETRAKTLNLRTLLG